jgi:hypothetical protein
MLGQHNYNQFSMSKVKFIKFVVGFAHLSMGKKKLLAPKLNNLLVHEGHHKAKS